MNWSSRNGIGVDRMFVQSKTWGKILFWVGFVKLPRQKETFFSLISLLTLRKKSCHVTHHVIKSFKLRKWFISLPCCFFFGFFFFGVWYRCLGFGTVVTVVVKGYRTVHELVNNFQVWRSNNYITGTHERHERRNVLISDWLPFAPKNWPYCVPKKHW